MIVKIDKSLEKDVYKIPSKTIRSKLARIITGIQDELYSSDGFKHIGGVF